jgi:membrane protein DedA with SNARE-associated domain
MERPGPLRGFRRRTIEKGDHLFQRFPRLAPLLAPAALSGVCRVTWPLFAVASVAAATSWTLSTGLAAYFVGPAATDILRDIGVRGAIAIVIVAALGLLYRYLLRRRKPLYSGSSKLDSP